jgi:cell wall-associated NlpC family hydrolase
MEFAVCSVSAAAVRREARHESEMVNQLLFGDFVRILENGKDGWVFIEGCIDKYKGWIRSTQLETVDEAAVDKENKWLLCSNGVSDGIETNAGLIHVPFGANLPGIKNGKGKIGTLSYSYSGEYLADRTKQSGNIAVLTSILNRWINAPYLWGGRTMLGVDCSGFTQIIFKVIGIDLLRDASEQAMQGQAVDFLQQANCGDLAFFDDSEGRIYHVGVLLNNHQIIHASGRVRIDAIDNAGIIHKSSGERTHRLRIVKRYF